MQISQSEQLQQLLAQKEKSPWLVALQVYQQALLAAEQLSNIRAKSSAIGIIGKLYTQKGNSTEAKQYLEQALHLALSIQASDLAYQWQLELGRLEQQQGNLERARQMYAAALDSIEQVRGNLLSGNPDIQFSFREKAQLASKCACALANSAEL